MSTTETLPATRSAELDDIARLGTWLAASESGSDSEKAKGAAAALRIYYARQLGLPPLAASELSVIGGRLVVSAQMLRAMALNAGYRVVKVSGDDQRCVAALINGNGEEIGRSEFTLEDARRAGLIRDKSGWQKYPARMLWARASSWVVKDHAPHVALGIVTEDEAAEIADRSFDVELEPADESEAETEVHAPPADLRLTAWLVKRGMRSRKEQLDYASAVVGRDITEEGAGLTSDEMEQIIERLQDETRTWPSDVAEP